MLSLSSLPLRTTDNDEPIIVGDNIFFCRMISQLVESSAVHILHLDGDGGPLEPVFYANVKLPLEYHIHSFVGICGVYWRPSLGPFPWIIRECSPPLDYMRLRCRCEAGLRFAMAVLLAAIKSKSILRIVHFPLLIAPHRSYKTHPTGNPTSIHSISIMVSPSGITVMAYIAGVAVAQESHKVSVRIRPTSHLLSHFQTTLSIPLS